MKKRLGFTMLMLSAFGGAAMGAEIKVLSVGAVEPALVKLADQFRRDTGNRVKIQFGTAPQLAKRLADGESADVLIAPPSVVEAQVKTGKIAAEGRVIVGRVGVGVTVRADAPSPDIATLDAFKLTLLNADSVVYNQASTGLYLEKLFDLMGIGEQLKGRTTRYANGAQVLEHVIGGKGNEIGFGAITEIRLFEPKGLRFVGPLPAQIQNYTRASISARTPGCRTPRTGRRCRSGRAHRRRRRWSAARLFPEPARG